MNNAAPAVGLEDEQREDDLKAQTPDDGAGGDGAAVGREGERETENDDRAHQWLRPGDAKLCSDRRDGGEARRRYDYRAGTTPSERSSFGLSDHREAGSIADRR